LLLSADKGYHHLEQQVSQRPPALVSHGSFSLTVNYHSIAEFCKQSGGRVLSSNNDHVHLNHLCMLFMDTPDDYPQTAVAFNENVDQFGPDDFYTLTQMICARIDSANYPELVAGVCLSRHDPHLFARMLPRFSQLAPKLNEQQRWGLLQVVIKVWDMFYPLGEDADLAFDIGLLLYELELYRQAMDFYALSEQIYGQAIGTLFNRALCYEQIGDKRTADTLIDKVLSIDPQFQPALDFFLVKQKK
jgi:tetratricopeptide (TPR) repeat protein